MSGDERLMFYYEKDCGCPFACFCRPEYDIFDNEHVKIGRIKNECKVCGMEIQIQDANGDIIYSVQSSMCKCGVLCEPYCGSCYPVSFNIKDHRKQGTTTSQFKKVSRGVVQELIFNANKYELQVSSHCLINCHRFLQTWTTTKGSCCAWPSTRLICCGSPWLRLVFCSWRDNP